MVVAKVKQDNVIGTSIYINYILANIMACIRVTYRFLGNPMGKCGNFTCVERLN